MIRLAWLQSRTQTLGTAALLAIVAVVAAITGVQLAHLYGSLTSSCQALGNCPGALSRFTSHDDLLQTAFDTLMRPVPALLGIFWGAPLLAREFETGTFRLAWTQGITRTRWLATKLAVGAGATAAIAGLLTLTVTWWFRGIDHVGANQYANFDSRDVVPIAYALFAFAIGALAGAMLRRTVPAMAATLAAFVAVRLSVAVALRPHLFTPARLMSSLAATQGTGFVASNGGPTDLVAGTPPCPMPGSCPTGS
jgi:ABC-type transport system involved in multi-copper enzyme maturation permease subunit